MSFLATRGCHLASWHDSGTTCTGSTGSRLCGVKIWWRSELWIKSCGTFCQSACLKLEHTHRDKQHSTVSQPFVSFFFVLLKILFHFLSPFHTKKSPWNQHWKCPISCPRCRFILSFVASHHEILVCKTITHKYLILIYCETLWHVHEAAPEVKLYVQKLTWC